MLVASFVGLFLPLNIDISELLVQLFNGLDHCLQLAVIWKQLRTVLVAPVEASPRVAGHGIGDL